MRTIDERIDALTHTVELLAEMHQTDWEKMKTQIHVTQQQINELAQETRRFRYWAEAVILNFDSRLRALAKEPPEPPMPDQRQ